MRNKTGIYTLACIFGFGILYWLDQFTKQLANTHLNGSDSIILIPGVLELRYLENRGAAFGMLQNQQWLFTLLTIFYLVIIVYAYVKIPKTRYYLPIIIGMVFLTAGALGNFYDRQVHKYVIDFIYFSLIDFPIFNVADIYVTCSVTIVGLLSIFHYKDEDFQFLMPKKAEN